MIGSIPWPWVVGLVVAVALLWPLAKKIPKFLARTVGAMAALWVFTPVGNLIGVHLGVNLFNGLVLALLGMPGFGLLLLLEWMV